MQLNVRKKHLLSLVLLAVAIGGYIGAASLPELQGNLNIVGAGFVPKILSCCLGLMAVLICFEKSSDERVVFVLSPELRMVLLFFALLFIYIFSISHIGFEISSFAFLVLTMLMLGLKDIRIILGIAVGLPLTIYLIFVKLMYIPIPTLIQGL